VVHEIERDASLYTFTCGELSIPTSWKDKVCESPSAIILEFINGSEIKEEWQKYIYHGTAVYLSLAHFL